jgi:hypothetical protein
VTSCRGSTSAARYPPTPCSRSCATRHHDPRRRPSPDAAAARRQTFLTYTEQNGRRIYGLASDALSEVATAYKYPRELTWIIGVAIRAAVASGMRIMWVAEN